MRRPRLGIVVLLVFVVGLGVVILVGSGWRGLAVYGFFVAFVALISLGTIVGGDFISRASRGRFDDRR